MFSAGQVSRMRAAMNSSTGDRSSLWTESNLQFTGIAEGFRSQCGPLADFFPRIKQIRWFVQRKFTGTQDPNGLHRCGCQVHRQLFVDPFLHLGPGAFRMGPLPHRMTRIRLFSSAVPVGNR